jgi:uncharacterized protein (DUF362 family)
MPNRRQILRFAAAVPLAWAAPTQPLPYLQVNPGKSRVVLARDAQLRPSGSTIDSARLLALLDRSIQALTGCDSPREAWGQIVRPADRVGLKVNCLAGRGLSTHVVLVEAICERLQQAGVRDIIIWDRLNADLESAHFKVRERGPGVRCIGNDVLGYEEELAVAGSVGSLLARTLTQACDAVINLPVLKDHGITGVTMALKNAFGALHNPNKYHLGVGDPYIADANLLPPVRQKFRLHICDALTAQYDGGPSFMPQWTWPENGLLVSRDPVALDQIGWRILERKRKEKGLKTLKEVNREPTYIATAGDAGHRLGTNDLDKIEVVNV